MPAKKSPVALFPAVSLERVFAEVNSTDVDALIADCLLLRPHAIVCQVFHLF
jgi:hypothetical protein